MRKNTPKYLIVHHTGGNKEDALSDSSSLTFEDIDIDHRNNPNVWLGEYSSLGYAIGYHFYIDKTGKLTQGRADTDEGAHTIGYNTDSIGICLAGNFDLTIPTTPQIVTLKQLLLKKMWDFNIGPEKIIPHRTFALKTCYGRHLADDWARSLVMQAMPVPDPCNGEKDEIVKKTSQIGRLQQIVQDLLAVITRKR